MTDAWIVSAARTPIGKFLGGLSKLSAPELGAVAVGESVRSAGLNPDQIDEVIMGNVISAGIGQAPARQAALKAGLPPTVTALTVNKVCGSGLEAVTLAARAIKTGDAQAVVAGGMESMSNAPHLAHGSREGWKFGDTTFKDALLYDGLWCAFEDRAMGMHAEYTAEKFGLKREELDAYAVQSQQRAAAARETNKFDDEIVPVTIKARRGDTIIEADEGPRAETTLDDLSRLRPAFQSDGVVTAGNASMLSDGAAAVAVVSDDVANALSPARKFRIVASFTSGTEPRDLFIAPVAATKGVLEKAGLSLADIDYFEINEAFASQMLACQRELGIEDDRLNIHGGAISLGHPLGASGARVLVTLLSILDQQNAKFGLATLCLGGGNAVAMIVERV